MTKKINIILDKRRILKDGTYPVRFSFFIKGKGNIMISSGIAVLERNFSAGGYIVGTERKETYNSLLHWQQNCIDDELIKLRMENKLNLMTLREIRQRILSRLENAITGEKTFDNVLLEYISTCTSDTARNTTNRAFALLTEYYGKKNISFQDIDLKFIERFYRYLLENISKNTALFYIQRIKVVFNYAITNEYISADIYPFRHFKIKATPTKKRNLTLEQLRTIRNYKAKNAKQQEIVDMFMLTFYLCGINAVDLFSCEKTNNGRVEYIRAKTKKLYSVKIEPEAQAIIDRYSGKEKLVNLSEKYKNKQRFEQYASVVLKQIFPYLSYYWARHTWATLCAELDIPKETISAGLGHSNGSVTDIYINFNQKKVDKANRQLIDYVNADIKKQG